MGFFLRKWQADEKTYGLDYTAYGSTVYRHNPATVPETNASKYVLNLLCKIS